MVVEQRFGCLRLAHQKHAGIGKIVAVEKFAARPTRSPDNELPVSPNLGFMGLADQGGQDVAGLQVVVVARAVEVGRHDRKVARAVLAVVGPAHLDARDLGQGVGAVRGFQGAAQKIGFADGLRTFPWIDAAGAQKKEVLHACLVGAVDDVGLDGQIGVDEIRRVCVVGVDASDFGGGQKDVTWPFVLEERTHLRLIHEVQPLQTHATRSLGAKIRLLAVDRTQDVLEALGQKGTHQGAADHAGRSGYEDFVCLVHATVTPAAY